MVTAVRVTGQEWVKWFLCPLSISSEYEGIVVAQSDFQLVRGVNGYNFEQNPVLRLN